MSERKIPLTADIQNNFTDRPLFTACGAPRPMAEEHLLTLYVNGEAAHTFTCSPAQLTELCLGWLLSEGYLAAPLHRLVISEDGHRADAEIDGAERIAPAPFPAFGAVDEARLASALALLHGDGTVHAKTRGAHACILSAPDGTTLMAEDIGRYNAADKAFGAALLRGIDLGSCQLLSSGRIPLGMVHKCVRAGIPVVTTKAATTAQAAAEARRLHLTLRFFTAADGSGITIDREEGFA